MSAKIETKGSFWALIPYPLLADTKVPSGAKMLYLHISGLLNTQGFCADTNAYLAERMQCSESSVTSYVSKLAERGYITVVVEPDREKGGNRRRIYPVIAGGISKKSGRGISQVEGGCPKNLGGDVPEICESTINNTKKKMQKEKKPEANAEEKLCALCAAYSREAGEAMGRFLSMRREIGKPVKSKQAATMLLNRLKKLSGEDAAHMVLLLDKATERQWLSLYALREDEQPGTAARKVDTEGLVFL